MRGRAAERISRWARRRPLLLGFRERGIGQAGVGGRGPGQCQEDLPDRRPRHRQAEGAADLACDLPIGLALAHGRHGRIEALHPALAGGEAALAFGERLRGQNHIGQLGCLAEEQLLHNEELRRTHDRREGGVVADRVGARNDERLLPGDVFGEPPPVGAHIQIPRALGVGPRPDTDQAVVRPANVVSIDEQVGGSLGHCRGALEAQPIGPEEDDPVLGVGESARRIAQMRRGTGRVAQGLQRCGFFAIVNAHDVRGDLVSLCRARRKCDHCGAALGCLANAQPPNGRFFF